MAIGFFGLFLIKLVSNFYFQVWHYLNPGYPWVFLDLLHLSVEPWYIYSYQKPWADLYLKLSQRHQIWGQILLKYQQNMMKQVLCWINLLRLAQAGSGWLKYLIKCCWNLSRIFIELTHYCENTANCNLFSQKRTWIFYFLIQNSYSWHHKNKSKYVCIELLDQIFAENDIMNSAIWKICDLTWNTFKKSLDLPIKLSTLQYLT